MSANTKHTELKVHLLRQDKSQRQIAKTLGITVTYLNDILRGRRKGEGIRQRLVAEFGIPAELIQSHQEEAA